MGRGGFNIEELRVFIKTANLYPVEKNLILLFERFDKDGDKLVKYEEFVAGLTPFDVNEMIN